VRARRPDAPDEGRVVTGVGVRLVAALIGLAAGIVAVVVVILLLHGTPGPA
jgi:hypothetical protein